MFKMWRRHRGRSPTQTGCQWRSTKFLKEVMLELSLREKSSPGNLGHSTWYMFMISCYSYVRLFATLWTAGLLCLRDSPGKNTGGGCCALLQGTFPFQGLHACLLCLLHQQAGSLPRCHLGRSKTCVLFHWLGIKAGLPHGRRGFYHWTTNAYTIDIQDIVNKVKHETCKIWKTTVWSGSI